MAMKPVCPDCEHGLSFVNYEPEEQDEVDRILEGYKMTNETVEFTRELTRLLNRYCKDHECKTPDYILAEHIVNYLKVYRDTLQLNAGWHQWKVL
jgi:hypothetical protein